MGNVGSDESVSETESMDVDDSQIVDKPCSSKAMDVDDSQIPCSSKAMDLDDSQIIDKPSSSSKAERNSETAKFELPESLNNVLKKAESISHCLAAGDIDTPGSL